MTAARRRMQDTGPRRVEVFFLAIADNNGNCTGAKQLLVGTTGANDPQFTGRKVAEEFCAAVQSQSNRQSSRDITMRRIFGIGLAFVVGAASQARAETKFTEARTTLEKWVETRQLISKEKSEWESDRENLQQSIVLYEKESGLLDEQITKLEAAATQVDKERDRLIEENESLSVAATTIRTTVAQLEKRLLELAKAFPPPLTERIEPLFKRIPTNPATTRLSLGERMQNIIGILSEADKFNGNITLVTELKKDPSGHEISVKTMYLGLGAAFFVDRAGQFAGVGEASMSGWTWRTANEVAPRISKMIFVYENAAAAEFVSMPVTFK
jgi:hypothetical protein